MTHFFDNHTLETAPEASRPLMQNAIDAFGMLPNLIAKMATSPTMTEAYLTMGDIFSRSSLSPVEQQVVLLTVSRFHNCSYCVGAHSVIADMQDVPEDIVNAIRDNRDIGDEKLHILRVFTEHVLEKRAWVDNAILQSFYNVGYTQENALDVIVGIAMKTLSNYTNHIAGTELDEAFSHREWNA
jgi:AhpD family alkylhydroperoxidase